MKTQTLGSNELTDATATRQSQIRKALLACGAISSLLYVAATIVGALVWEGYNPISQAVSELSAIGAPSRPIMLALFGVYDALLIVFAWGIWGLAGRRWALRIVAVLLVGISLAGLCAGLFGSMHMRGVEATSSDTLHIILTIVTVLCIFLSVGLGATAFGKPFRLYSIVTIVVIFAFGILAGMDGPRVAANLPTRWLGLTERINIFGYMLWVAVFSLGLLRNHPDGNRK